MLEAATQVVHTRGGHKATVSPECPGTGPQAEKAKVLWRQTLTERVVRVIQAHTATLHQGGCFVQHSREGTTCRSEVVLILRSS